MTPFTTCFHIQENDSGLVVHGKNLEEKKSSALWYLHNCLTTVSPGFLICDRPRTRFKKTNTLHQEEPSEAKMYIGNSTGQLFTMIHSLYYTDFVSVVVVSAEGPMSRWNRPRVISLSVAAFLNTGAVSSKRTLQPPPGPVASSTPGSARTDQTPERYEGGDKATWRLVTNA